MRTIERLYREFCDRMARACEDEANRYDEHLETQDADRQFIRVLRQRCEQWRREVHRLNAAYGIVESAGKRAG
jgi:hypothetical protein